MSEEHGSGTPADDLLRLRREVNRLRRRIQDLETEAANSTREARDVQARLSDEVTNIKASRVWRLALCLRRLRELVSWRHISGNVTGARADHEPADRRARQYEAYLNARAMTNQMRQELRDRVAALACRPLISIVMPVHDVSPVMLNAAVRSVRAQIYDNWELCIVDDASSHADTVRALDALDGPGIRIERLERNFGIAGATNRAIEMARGDYVAFMDHDDALAEDALVEVAAEINESGADFIYSDEDNLDEHGRRVNPHFKPDYSPDLLLAHNYITHLVVVHRDLPGRTGGLRSEFDGAQDYDFVLRATEQARCIRHIPKVLYHWRMSGSSTSVNADSKPRALERGRLALNQALERRGRDGLALVDPVSPHFYRVRYAVRGNPLVSILIPFRDKADLLHCVIGDVVERTAYQNFEIIGINNGSVEDESFAAMRDLAGLDERVRFTDYDFPFNFSAIMNHGAKSCSGQHMVFLNNDIRLLNEEWLEAMLEHSQQDETGAVGGKLYYPDSRVQHAGIVIGIDNYAGHSHKGFPGDHQGYFNRLQVVQNVSAVTGAFMMIGRDVFDQVGGFDEENFAIACNDVDLCLRVRAQGLWNVFTPYADGRHLESATRGYEDTPAKQARFAAEKSVFRERHAGILEHGDPFYNPNLTRTAEDFSIRVDEAS
ncbi:MAG TPA: glycosyltransferase [Arenicellales bacterium]|nr:glycosyltransferase [Arenicellales bacterium]